MSTHRLAWLVLPLLCGVQFVDAWDVASMGPTLPRIGSEFGLSPEALQWVVTAYVVGYGGFVLLGGRLADLVDRKRLLIGALAVFVVASVVGGLAESGGVLIAARFVKGVAAAFSAPVALSILLHVNADPVRRNRALGLFASLAAIGFTLGLVLGGVLAEVSWRLVLFAPAGVALALLVAAPVVLPAAPRPAERERTDVAGAVLVTAGASALVSAFSRAAGHGWRDPLTLGTLVLGAALLVAFARLERRLPAPLVSPALLRRPGIARANAAIFLLQGAYVAWQYAATLYLQDERGWSPVAVGLIFAPGGVVTVLTSQRCARAVSTYGPWRVLVPGLVVATLGFAATLALGHVAVLFPLVSVVLGVGYTMASVAANIAAVAPAAAEEQGLASGVFIASFQLGAGVVLGIAGSVLGAAPDAYRAAILVAVVAAALGVAIAGGQARRKAVGVRP